MRASLFIILTSLIILLSCHRQRKDNGQTYNTEYVVGTIHLADDFLKLNENEKILDSIFDDSDKSIDSLISFNPKYKENNLLYKNGEQRRPDSAVSMPCHCLVDKDTMFASMIVGFFGGEGFNIKLYSNNFESGYFTYTDDVKPFKSNLSDTAFYDYANANAKFQYLVVDKKPTYKLRQQITGYLTFTSNNYYENQFRDKLDSIYVSGKLYFTCQTRQKTESQIKEQ